MFEKIASTLTQYAGSLWAFLGAVIIILLWLMFGPVFSWSESYQLLINTLTTIITFLMVFAIQHTNNKDTLAIQTKLNELIKSVKGADNKFINIENLTEEQLKTLSNELKKCQRGIGSEQN